MPVGPGALATFAVALLAAPPAAADDDVDLLRRHAPVLHYDARERDTAGPTSSSRTRRTPRRRAAA